MRFKSLLKKNLRIYSRSSNLAVHQTARSSRLVTAVVMKQLDNEMNAKNKYIDLIKKESLWFSIFTAIAVMMPILSLIIPIKPSSEELSSWFQRSGAAMVVCSLLAESKAISIYNLLNPSGFVSLDYKEAERQFESRPILFNRISFFIIAIGTLIWGYGDLMV